MSRDPSLLRVAGQDKPASWDQVRPRASDLPTGRLCHGLRHPIKEIRDRPEIVWSQQEEFASGFPKTVRRYLDGGRHLNGRCVR